MRLRTSGESDDGRYVYRTYNTARGDLIGADGAIIVNRICVLLEEGQTSVIARARKQRMEEGRQGLGS